MKMLLRNYCPAEQTPKYWRRKEKNAITSFSWLDIQLEDCWRNRENILRLDRCRHQQRLCWAREMVHEMVESVRMEGSRMATEMTTILVENLVEYVAVVGE